MDWADENGESSSPTKSKRPKKTVMIDETRDIKFINIERQPSKAETPFFDNVDVYAWPWRIATGIFLLGYLFLVLGYTTPFWIIAVDAGGIDVSFAGLWCAGAEIKNCTFRSDISTCLNAVRTFGGIGLICGIVVVVLLVCQIKKPNLRSCLNRGIAANCFVAALSVQIATAIFWRSIGCDYEDVTPASSASHRWAWSLALSFTSVLLAVVAGLLFLIIEMISISRRAGINRKAWNGRGFLIT